jgi:hypothetical protein
LVDRISRAIDHHRSFRVIVLTPLYCEGGYSNLNVRATMYLQYSTMSRFAFGMISRLQIRYPTVDISNYLVFMSTKSSTNAKWYYESIHGIHSCKSNDY